MAVLEQYRTAVLAVAAVVLLGLGALAGAGAAYWVTSDHYRPIVKDLQDKIEASASTLASCRTTSSTLEGQVGQQNLALANLQRAAESRAVQVKADQRQAEEMAEERYRMANRYQLERTGGDSAAAAASIIDQALGL